MNFNPQLIALYTLLRREIVRMCRIFTQVFIPPVITTLLYFLIFGAVMGKRIGPVAGLSYPEFIAPGLIMMGVITNAYGNVSSSLFNVRFQRNIEEMLVSPMHYSIMLAGFVLGGVMRGIIVAVLVFLVALFFVPLQFNHIVATFIVIALVSALFSLAGFTNALLARNFDDIAIIPTFILGPLTYLGGVFYSTEMLPPFWKAITWFNPILYMINALRHFMTGQQEVHLVLALVIIVGLVVGLIILNLLLLKKGVGIRNL